MARESRGVRRRGGGRLGCVADGCALQSTVCAADRMRFPGARTRTKTQVEGRIAFFGTVSGRVDRARRPDYKPRSRPLRLGSAQVAQLVEHATENRSVGGSIPPLGTTLLLSACFESK